MHLRFNRSVAVREAYRRYDAGRYTDVITYSTAELASAGADPELLIARGGAYLARDRPNEAAADWRACCGDSHLAPVAHYYLGNLLAAQFVEHHPAAWDHFDRAAALGWAEGHIGRGDMLMARAFRLRDAGGSPADVADGFRAAVAELSAGLASPAAKSRCRALSLRGSAYFNLGDLAAFERDAAAARAVAVVILDSDPRATGSELYR
jgi:hypothetical protein